MRKILSAVAGFQNIVLNFTSYERHIKLSGVSWTLESLLGSFGNKKSVIRRMRIDFSNQVTLALLTGDAELARDTYFRAEAMPSHATIKHFELDGYKFGGQIYPGSSLVFAYRGLSSFVVKMLKNGEKARVAAFQHDLMLKGRDDDCISSSNTDLLLVHQHIVPFKLWEDPNASDRIFMVMPWLQNTLEPMRELATDHASLLISQLASALRFLHGIEFAHCDVKPRNICINGGPPVASFVLIDLGSIQRFGSRVLSTLP